MTEFKVSCPKKTMFDIVFYFQDDGLCLGPCSLLITSLFLKWSHEHAVNPDCVCLRVQCRKSLYLCLQARNNRVQGEGKLVHSLNSSPPTFDAVAP